MRQLFLAIIAVALTGCAGAALFQDPSTLYVDYMCNPEGATLYQDNVAVGTCPTRLHYQITDADRAQGYKLLKGTTATWVSGASISTPAPIIANLKNGLQQHFNLERPRNVAGYDTDANYALNLQRNRILAAQAKAESNAADAAALSNALLAASAERWSHLLRQPAKVDSPMQRTNHHEDAETVFG